MRAVYAECECGWSGTYDTERRAAYARGRHSCERWRAISAAIQRGIERDRSIDRTPKPCHHARTDHQHGTRACYVLDRCRCLPCAAAASQAEQDRLRAHAYGRDLLVDAQPVRDHMQALQDAGMGWKRIARQAGISTGTITKIVYGSPRPDGTRRPPARRVRPETAEAILSVRATLDTLAPSASIDATGTARRIQALAYAGWSIQQIADQAGLGRQALDRALRGRPVLVRTARAIRDTYDTLWDQAPPETSQQERTTAERARRSARAAGWAPALAWDGDQIDDPDATPHLGDPTSIDSGGRLDEWMHLVRFGEDHDRAARRVGVLLDTIERTAYRLGREDVLRVLTAAAEERRRERTHVIPVETRHRRMRRGRVAA